ncbi:hypothetical protein [Kluyvera ascorbata]|uniref:hypothetical protein n=1 Tax=Kluyvera ascorbata TaxID=51288 RepID=UPI00215DC17C|nr:hypothetical protein [Kluyvera ascorbata]
MKQGVKPEAMLEGVKRYAVFMAADNKIGTEFVKQTSTFFGPDRHFEDEWAVAVKLPEQQQSSSSQSWYAKPNDGSAEVFINQAAIDRMKRGVTAHENEPETHAGCWLYHGFLREGFVAWCFDKFDLRECVMTLLSYLKIVGSG